MRRLIRGWAITAIATLATTVASAADHEVAQRIADGLRTSGRLVDYSIGVKYQDGTAWLLGRVRSEEQMNEALAMTRQMPDVSRVVNKLSVEPTIAPPGSGEQPGAETSISPSADNTADRLLPLPPTQPTARQAARRLAGPAGGTAVRPLADHPARHALGPAVHAVTERVVRPAPQPAAQVAAPEALRRASQPRSRPAPQPAAQVAAPEPLRQPTQPVVRPIAYPAAVEHDASQSGNAGAQANAAPPATKPKSAWRRNAHPRGPAGPAATGNSGSVAAAPAGLRQPIPGASHAVVPAQRVHPVPHIEPVPTAPSSVVPMQAHRIPVAQPVQDTRQSMAPARQIRRAPPGYQLVATGPVPQSHAVPSGPIGMYVSGVAAQGGPAYYDQPHMPNYAWPSYASYPNYAGLTYPTQYSPTAWPYIGPFYPYPQVPLGWRKVTLEWDDGWWFLDFDDRSGH